MFPGLCVQHLSDVELEKDYPWEHKLAVIADASLAR